MKKILLLFLIFLLVPNLNAQFIRNYGIKFGIVSTDQYVRVHIPEGNIDPVAIFQPNRNFLGLTVGLNAEFLNCPPFSLVFEGNYIQKGFRDEWTSYNELTGEQTIHIYKMRFDYLSFSLLAKAKVTFGIISPYILVGPRLDISIANEDSFYDKYNNKYIPGLVIGLGSEVSLCKIKLLAEIIYDFSLGNLQEDGYETVSYESYMFRLGILL